MIVLPLTTITDAMLVSSSIPEPDASMGEALWVAGTTYAKGARVIRTQTHRIYESQIDGNVGNTPEAVTSANKWLEVGVTNRWAMFDTLRNSQSVAASPLTITLAPGKRITACALMRLDGDSATVTVTNAQGQQYASTRNLIVRRTASYLDYCIKPFRKRGALLLKDIPPVASPTITLTLTSSSGTVRIGAQGIGQSVYIGEATWGVDDDILNFTQVDRDAFGNAKINPGRGVPTQVPSVVSAKGIVSQVRALRDATNGVPAVYATVEDDSDEFFDGLLLLGIWRRWKLRPVNPLQFENSLELEEV